MTPDEKRQLSILPHVRYELEMLFYTPPEHTDPRVKNAVIESGLIHVRSLNAFFSPQTNARKDDVLPEDFGFASRATGVDQNVMERLNKDLAHISYHRLKHTAGRKRWLPEQFVPQLATRSIEFAQHVLNQYEGQLPCEEVRKWQKLLAHLKTIRQS